MAHRHNTNVNDVSQLTPRKPPPLPPPPLLLPGMEIAMPPGTHPATPLEHDKTSRRKLPHQGDSDSEEYRKVAALYANRPLPPLPPSRTSRQKRPPEKLLPLNITRKSIGATSGTASSEKMRDIVMKPLPPTPSHESAKNKPVSRRMSRSCPPTGHQPTQKAQRLMGCDVDIYDDTLSRYASRDSRFLEEDLSSEYSQEADQIFDRSISPMGNSYSSARHIRFSDTGPLTPTSQISQIPSRTGSYQYRLDKPIHSAYERFSDRKASSEYHKFTQELACDAGLAGNGSAHSESSSSRGGIPRPVMYRRGAGHQVTSRTSPEATQQRLSSCFEHGDDEDDGRGLPGAEVASRLMGSMKGFVNKAKEKHSKRAADKVEREGRRREEGFKKSFKVVEGSGRRVR